MSEFHVGTLFGEFLTVLVAVATEAYLDFPVPIALSILILGTVFAMVMTE